MIVERFDRPWLLGRTPRELAVLAIGGFGVGYGFLGDGLYAWAWIGAFAAATVAFAARFWPARAVAVGTCLASLAQLACVRTPGHWPWVALVPVIALAILASRDLSARFEQAPSRVRWFPNVWAALPADDARRLRWSAYALGVVAAVCEQEWVMRGAGFPWSPWVFATAAAAIVLLCLGRAGVLVVVAGLSAAIAIAAARALVAPPLAMRRAAGLPSPRVVAALAVGSALIALVLAVPYAARLVRRTIGGAAR